MRRIFLLENGFWHDDAGVTSVEYALIASLIAMVILVGIMALGGTLKLLWDKIAICVANPSNCG